MDFQRQEIIYHNRSGSFEAVDNNHNGAASASELHRVDNGKRSSRPASAPSKIINNNSKNNNNNHNSHTTLKPTVGHNVFEDVFVEDSNCHSDFFIPQHTAQHDIVRDEKLGHAAKLRKLAAKFYSTSDDGDINETNHDIKQQQQQGTIDWKEDVQSGVDMHDIYKSNQVGTVAEGEGEGEGGVAVHDDDPEPVHSKAENNHHHRGGKASLRLMKKKKTHFSRTTLFLAAPSRQQLSTTMMMMPNFISKRKRGVHMLPMDVRVPKNILQDSIYDHAYGNHDIGSRGQDFNELNVPLPGTSTHGSASNWVKLMERTIASAATATAASPPRANSAKEQQRQRSNANADYERDHGWRTAQDWDYQGNSSCSIISLKHPSPESTIVAVLDTIPTYLPTLSISLL